MLTIGRLCQFCGVDFKDADITYVRKSGVGGETPVIKKDDDSAREDAPELRILTAIATKICGQNTFVSTPSI